MAYYLARIQLDGKPDETAYERLHEAMRLAGYSRTIKSDERKTYRLPHGEYVSAGFGTLRQAFDAAYAAAGRIQASPKTFLTEATAMLWENLTELKTTPSR